MDVRLKHQEKMALDLAEWLAARPEVKQVLHPARPDCPGHALWKRDFTGASGLFSIILHPIEKPALAAFLDPLSLFGMGFSWGGFESLIVPCNPRPIRTATAWDEPGQLLRLSVGLEHIDDLKADLAAGFERMKAAQA
jgi:cystathionine beta-lyase